MKIDRTCAEGRINPAILISSPPLDPRKGSAVFERQTSRALPILGLGVESPVAGRQEMGIADEHFGKVWPVHVDGLIALLTRLRVAFDGDLDAALIMAVIGSAALPRGRLPDDLSFDAFQKMERRDAFYTPLNSLSIAQITGIPRETARRKLAAMAKRGWIMKDEAGFWHVHPDGAQELEPMTSYSIEYLNRLASALG
ncbi:MAG: hypothetical protein V2I74_12120 [Erythrobacter sp.]|nr:hypothetical protein [Erythrobacter sp.]